MKLFLDTSVLIASVLQDNDAHARALAVLERIQTGRDEGFVSAHSLAEMYSVLTRYPAPSRHSPEQALLSIDENVVKHFQIVNLSGRDYIDLIRDAAGAGIKGGTIYDAVLMKCAEKAAVGRIYTLNLRHFQAVAPGNLRAVLAVP
jgi:predicted nucleic acid-binding protein